MHTENVLGSMLLAAAVDVIKSKHLRANDCIHQHMVESQVHMRSNVDSGVPQPRMARRGVQIASSSAGPSPHGALLLGGAIRLAIRTVRSRGAQGRCPLGRQGQAGPWPTRLACARRALDRHTPDTPACAGSRSSKGPTNPPTEMQNDQARAFVSIAHTYATKCRQ